MSLIMLSLGGSVIHPDTGIDIKFLKGFNELIRKEVALGRRFFIMVGSGYIGREYQYAARLIHGEVATEDLNWLGIHGTELNAHLVRTVFSDLAYPKLISKLSQIEEINEKQKLFVGCGNVPGASTDFDLVRLAENVKSELIVSLLNVKQIYDKDPKLFPEAKPLFKISWTDYKQMVGDWWNPERQLPFDPFAAKLAHHLNLKIIFSEGRSLKNLENILEGRKFTGTVIE